MKQILDTGETVAFGQALSEAEAIFACKAGDVPLPIARKGTDAILITKAVSLQFDSGRLKEIEFGERYQFINPLTPYPETWKNFPDFNLLCVRKKMPSAEFLSYLAAWQRRAQSLGAEKVNFGDLNSNQYYVGEMKTLVRGVEMLHISMGPSRRSGGGGIWCDGWSATFSVGADGKLLRSLSAFRDEFNTVARRSPQS